MDDLRATRDKIEIQELLYRYARACDSRDWDLLTSVFTDDAQLDYSSSDARSGPATRSSAGWSRDCHNSRGRSISSPT